MNKHKNPDGEIIRGSHIHIYKEEHGIDYAEKFDPMTNELTEICKIFFEKFCIINARVSTQIHGDMTMTNIILNQDINIPNIIDNYVALIRSEIDGQKVGEYTEFSFPFLDRHNDYMCLYIKPIDADLFEVTDGGQIIDNLEMSGITLTGTRKTLANNLAKTYGVNITNGALTIKSSQKSLANSKHRLLQLMMKLDDLFFLAR